MPQNPSFRPSYLLAAPLPARIYGQSRLPIPHMSPPHESPGPGGEETRRCPPHPACSSRQPSNGTPHADAAFTSALPPPRLLAPAHLAHLRDTTPRHLCKAPRLSHRHTCRTTSTPTHENTQSETGFRTLTHAVFACNDESAHTVSAQSPATTPPDSPPGLVARKLADVCQVQHLRLASGGARFATQREQPLR